MSHELESLHQAFLDTLFADAHVLRITDERETSLFVEVRGDDVCAVRDMLRIHEHDNPPTCYCAGGPWIDIYGHDRSVRARLAIHHALSLEYGGGGIPDGSWTGMLMAGSWTDWPFTIGSQSVALVNHSI